MRITNSKTCMLHKVHETSHGIRVKDLLTTVCPSMKDIFTSLMVIMFINFLRETLTCLPDLA